MARPKGAKNKTAVEKIEDAIQVASEAFALASTEEQKSEIEEAIDALVDATEPDAPKGTKLVGVHPITKEPVYL